MVDTGNTIEKINDNNTMKKTIYNTLIILLMPVTALTSCLRMGLDELPAYNEAEILDFNFEYRWYDGSTGLGRMYVQELNVSNLTIDSETATVSLDLIVPAASGNFPESERDRAGLENIVGYCDISLAATIAPIGDAPVLGEIGNWSAKDFEYRVCAADGSEKIWRLTINSFNK